MTFLFFKYLYKHPIAGKKRTLTKMTTRFHLMKFVDTCHHSLSLVVTRGHSLSLSLVCTFINHPRKTSTDQKKIFTCALQKEFPNKIENVQEKYEILAQ